MVRYLSVCSGIEAASCAWHPLEFEPVAFSEIEPFPCSVLKHHYPDVPNFGDMTKYQEWPDANIDLLVGGTPCQSFSIAGLRAGLDDPRGNLMLTYLAIAGKYRPRWLVWENVPGVLSSNGGRDFGTFLAGLAELGYGFAYRILDAQYFGVPQRRRRVFVVGYIGDWRRAASVLFERESLSGNPAPRRQTGEEIAATLSGSTGGCNNESRAGAFVVHGTQDPCASHNAFALGRNNGQENVVLIGLDSEHNASNDVIGALTCHKTGGNHGAEIWTKPYCDNSSQEGGLIVMSHGQSNAEILEDLCPTLNCNHENPIVAGVGLYSNANATKTETIQTAELTMQTAHASDPQKTMSNMTKSTELCMDVGIRRLTPRECERLQGFPDDYTNVPHRNKPASDTARYQSLGNSMAVPVMRWIGERIKMVDEL